MTTNTMKKTPHGTEYYDSVVVFNGNVIITVRPDHSADSIIDTEQYATKQALVEAVALLGIRLDPAQPISIEDGDMNQFHYFK